MNSLLIAALAVLVSPTLTMAKAQAAPAQATAPAAPSGPGGFGLRHVHWPRPLGSPKRRKAPR